MYEVKLLNNSCFVFFSNQVVNIMRESQFLSTKISDFRHIWWSQDYDPSFIWAIDMKIYTFLVSWNCLWMIPSFIDSSIASALSLSFETLYVWRSNSRPQQGSEGSGEPNLRGRPLRSPNLAVSGTGLHDFPATWSTSTAATTKVTVSANEHLLHPSSCY